jgi:hypothetical protein
MRIELLDIENQSSNRCGAAVSAKANLREQVKPQWGGRSQNRRVAKGLPI